VFIIVFSVLTLSDTSSQQTQLQIDFPISVYNTTSRWAL